MITAMNCTDSPMSAPQGSGSPRRPVPARVMCMALVALLLLGFNFGLSAVVWWPFLKAYERRLSKSGQAPQERGS